MFIFSEAKASHSHKMWTEVSSSVPYFLQVGLLPSPIIYKCLLKVLCPVSRLITILECVLLKDNNWALVARSGPEINSRDCLCVLQRPHHNTRCRLSIQCFVQRPPRKAQVQQTIEQNRLSRACRQFRLTCIIMWHS